MITAESFGKKVTTQAQYRGLNFGRGERLQQLYQMFLGSPIFGAVVNEQHLASN
jgi:hypothetical protein